MSNISSYQIFKLEIVLVTIDISKDFATVINKCFDKIFVNGTTYICIYALRAEQEIETREEMKKSYIEKHKKIH